MVYRNPVYHQIVFASLIVITTLRVTYILQLSEASQRIPAKAKKIIIRFFSTGAAMFALGFLIWNLDNIFCHTLTTWKVSIGWPIAFLLEGQFLFPLIVPAYTSLTLFVFVFGRRSLLVACFNCVSIFFIFFYNQNFPFWRDYCRVLGLIINSLVSNVCLLHFFWWPCWSVSSLHIPSVFLVRT